LHDKPSDTDWQRNNHWMLHRALSIAGGSSGPQIALWDGSGQGEGPGGTPDMVQTARSRGAKLRHIDTKQLMAEEVARADR
jgi:hypothetical protein